MKKKRKAWEFPIWAGALLLGVAAAHPVIAEPSRNQSTEKLIAPIVNTKGTIIGEATLTQLAHGVKVEVLARSLPQGELAVHFHETGTCEAPDFKSAGEHFDPKEQKHGFDVKGGPHAGDLPNLLVGKDGVARMEVINSRVTLAPAPETLLKPGGTALIIHSRADDYKSQPTGKAGDRIACAEIKRG